VCRRTGSSGVFENDMPHLLGGKYCRREPTTHWYSKMSMTVVGVAGAAHQFGPGVESLALFRGGRVAAKSLCAIRLGFSREFTICGRCSFRLVLRRPVSMWVRSSWLAPEAGVGCARFFQIPNQHLLVCEAIQTVGVPVIAHRFLNRVFGFVSRWPSLFVLSDSASRGSSLPVN
jgi:hypothetical protein